jgi:hypothetical protein
MSNPELPASLFCASMLRDFLGKGNSVSNAGDNSESFKELVAAVKGLQVVVWAHLKA